MTSPIINAKFSTAPLPEWLAITLIVLIFIAVSIVSAYLAYKFRSAQYKLARENERKELPDAKE